MTSAIANASPPSMKYRPQQSRWSPHNRAVIEQLRNAQRLRTEVKRDQRRAERMAAQSAALASCETLEAQERRATAFANAALLTVVMSPAIRRVLPGP